MEDGRQTRRETINFAAAVAAADGAVKILRTQCSCNITSRHTDIQKE